MRKEEILKDLELITLRTESEHKDKFKGRELHFMKFGTGSQVNIGMPFNLVEGGTLEIAVFLDTNEDIEDFEESYFVRDIQLIGTQTITDLHQELIAKLIKYKYETMEFDIEIELDI